MIPPVFVGRRDAAKRKRRRPDPVGTIVMEVSGQERHLPTATATAIMRTKATTTVRATMDRLWNAVVVS